MDNTLDVLTQLQEEIELYCDPNEKVSSMIETFIKNEERLKAKEEELNNG